MSCITEIDIPIFNIFMNNRLCPKLYVFIGIVEKDVQLIINKISSEEKITTSEKNKLEKDYKKYLDFWLKTAKKYPIRFINDKIYPDDTVTILKKKIFFYLSDKTKQIFYIENNQEIWIENQQHEKSCFSYKKYVKLGHYYKNYEYTPSIHNKIQVDFLNFVDDMGIPRYLYDTLNNFNTTLNDIINIDYIKNYTIHVNNLEIELDYLKKKHIPINNLFINGYINKYWVKSKINFDKKQYDKSILKYNDLFNFDKYLINLVHNNTYTDEYFEGCYITSLRLKTNYCNLKYKDYDVKQNLNILTKIFNLIEVSEDIPFIKFKKRLDWISPMIKLHRSSVKDIKYEIFLDWIQSNPRGLLIKKYIYTIKGEKKYVSINIFDNATVEVNLSFIEEYKANLDIVKNIINEINKLFQKININIIQNKKRYISLIDIDFKKDSINETELTKILYLNFVIILKRQDLNIIILNKISKMFSTFLVKTVESDNNINFRLKYKRRSNFKNLHEIFDDITDKKEEGMLDSDIKKEIQEKYQKTFEEINKLFSLYYKLFEVKEIIKQPGIDIQIPKDNSKIKIYGCNKLLELYNITKVLFTIFDITYNFKKYQKLSDFSKYLKNSEKYLNISDNFYQENEINLNDVELNKFDKNNNLSNYLDNTSDNNSLDNNKNNSKDIVNNSDIDPILRLRCEQSGKEKKIDSCVDLCEDLYFRSRRLQKHDLNLFKFKAKLTYSKQCQRNTQPIVLDYDPAKNPKIKRESYTYAIKYGSNPEKQNYYICPKVWCPYCEIPLNMNQVLNIQKFKRKHGLCLKGKCPYGDHDVFIESQNYYDNTDNGLYPGFVKNKHPDGYCLPCCKKNDMRVSKYSGYKAHKECLGEDINKDENDISFEKYILDSNKIPLEKNRLGALPRVLQQLFKNVYKHGHIEMDVNYFLRIGAGLSQNESFIQAILKVISDEVKEIEIDEFKKALMSKITEKLFKSLNNGNLELIFENNKKSSYENYLDYINSDIYKDEKYLWDLFSRPNILYPNGINIFILTSNIILCPKNSNIDNIYDLNRDSIFLFKYNQYYEPIYLIKKVKRNDIKKTIKFNPTYNEPTMLYKLIQKNCSSYYNIDWKRLLKDNEKILKIKYNIFKTNECTKKEFLNEINKLPQNFQIKCQVVDDYNKLIGYILNNNVFYPIKPTNIDIKYEICDKDYKLLSYKEVVKEYKTFSKYTNLPFKIVGKIVDSSKNVVNVLVLENGRYIHIKDTKIQKDLIPILDTKYYSDADKYIKEGLQKFDDKQLLIKKFDYDNESYNRYTFELSKYVNENLKYKDEIKEVVGNEDDINLKYNKISDIIFKITKKLVTNKRIINIDFENYITPNIRRPCYMYSRNKNIKDICLSDPHCSYYKNKCSMYFPKFSFYSNKNNNQFYIEKLSYDLLKNRIKYFNFIKDEIIDISDDTRYIPKENELFIYGYDFIEQFKKIYDIIEDKYTSKKDIFDNTDHDTSYSVIDSMLYSETKKDDNIFLELLSESWIDILSKNYKILKTNIINGSLFYSITRAHNSISDENLTIEKIKYKLIDYLKNISLENFLRLLTKFEDLKDDIDFKIKNVRNLIYQFYKFVKFRDIISYDELILMIQNIEYDGTPMDIYILSEILNYNISIIHYRKTSSNPDAFTKYNLKNHENTIILYSEVYLKGKVKYSCIQNAGKYVFKKEDLTPKFLKLL